MVVTNGIEAIQYYHAISDYLQERKSRYQALVAFSGEHEYGGAKVSEASLNGLPSAQIAERFQEDPTASWCARTSSRPATTSRCCTPCTWTRRCPASRRCRPCRASTGRTPRSTPCSCSTSQRRRYHPHCVRGLLSATILADETDPNKLHDLQADLDRAQVYSEEQVDEFVRRQLGGVERDRLDPILDACVEVYRRDLDEDGQVEFKGNAKGFIHTYGFLSAVLPYRQRRLGATLDFSQLPGAEATGPEEPDLSKGILDAIDLDSSRAEKQAMHKILLPDEDAEIGPVPTSAGGHRPEPELDRLSNILRTFNEHFGDIRWEDADRVTQLITETIPARVAADTAFRNARQNSDRQKRPHRARQGAAAGDDRCDARRH